jgi:hypothetical protein
MPNAEICRQHAEECRRKAETVSDACERANWMKLADDWTAASRIPFRTRAKESQPANAGLWRGDVASERNRRGSAFQ